jgi:hypothetical protein
MDRKEKGKFELSITDAKKHQQILARMNYTTVLLDKIILDMI